MNLTFLPSLTSFSLLQLLNAFAFIFITVSGIIIFVKVPLSNALFAISVTGNPSISSGIVTFIPDALYFVITI